MIAKSGKAIKEKGQAVVEILYCKSRQCSIVDQTIKVEVSWMFCSTFKTSFVANSRLCVLVLACF